jgi:hypothetical protein
VALERRRIEITGGRAYAARMRRLLAVVTFVLGGIGVSGAQPAPALKIVVLEGEGAVNIIQQKTAVRPLVEVRDRNNLPVAGASVTFTIGGGGQGAAFAGGAQTLTVTTNAAGQAAASGFNAIGNGAFQIQVQAAYQGQIATAAISQTNVATAAAAAQAGAGAGGSGTTSGAAGGAAGGGGGVSGTTLGIVGATVAGGALAATQVVGKSDEGDEGDANANLPDPYTGPLTGQLVSVSNFTPTVGPPTSCSRTRAVSGTMTIELHPGNATGIVRAQVTQTEIALSGGCIAGSVINFSVLNAPVSGGPSGLTFTHAAPVGSENYTLEFTGALAGSVITGTLRITAVLQGNPTGGGTTTMPVSLSFSRTQ